MKWAMLDSAGRPSGFYHPDVHPELFEQVGEDLRPRGPIAGAVSVSDQDWQDLVSNPGRRRIENGRVVAIEPPPPSPDAQAEADRALLREAMLRDQLEDWIEHRAAAPAGLSPAELAALQRLRAAAEPVLINHPRMHPMRAIQRSPAPRPRLLPPDPVKYAA